MVTHGENSAIRGTDVDEPLEWQIATVTRITPETSNVKTFTLQLPAWMRHHPGQHYDIRLTAPDGYQAERSYSVASEPERSGEIDITVEKIDDGEVSPYLHEVLVVGDRFEVRGPIGGYFVWDAETDGSALLVAGGSGIVPLMAMVRHRAAIGSRVRTSLLYSSRSRDAIIYARELEQLEARMDGLDVVYTLTRDNPHGWTGFTRRIDRAMLRQVAEPLGGSLRSFVCGPTALVESVAEDLVASGLAPSSIKTERFGPTGT
jgi:ferredoxin-NADP reductase